MAAIEVILLERVEKLGQMGAVVRVKPGFARNYLLPQRKAMRATKSNMVVFEAQRSELEALNLQRRQEAEGVAEQMKDIRLVLVRAAGESGQLYGSVAARDIQEALKADGVKVERRQIEMDQVIKVLGASELRIRLHPEVVVTIAVIVARSLEEAEAGFVVEEEEEVEDDIEAVEGEEYDPDFEETEEDAEQA
jgi:large subunit ribosomal protein L9